MMLDPKTVTLDEWQKAVLPVLRNMSFERSVEKLRQVTLLAYFFWDDDRIETKFYTIECAFLCAFKSFGLMPAVLVVNRETRRICEFCEKYSIELQVDASLTGGVPTMNIDCVRNLHRRFATNWVLIIQSDGIPVNSGLERFLGKYDYYGAPWAGHSDYLDWFPYPKYGVGNGGFSLRTKRICAQAAKSYNAFWRFLPYYWRFVGDDTFYCKTMPCFSSKWRRMFKYPSIKEASEFALEGVCKDVNVDKPPIGFHAEGGFRQYVNRFGIPFADYICKN